MSFNFGIMIMLVALSNKSNCFSVKPDRALPLELQTDAVSDWYDSSGRVIRQTLGYPSSVQSRDQTVIVVPNSVSNLPYRGVPTYGSNRSPAVIVNVPGENSYPTSVGRRYIENSNRV